MLLSYCLRDIMGYTKDHLPASLYAIDDAIVFHMY